MSWADKSLKEFQDALASDAPTPGGGSAVGVALGQAAALSIMVCELTLSNEKYKDGWSISERIKEIATPLLILGLDLSLRDSEAFDEVVDSFRLPKDTEEEKLDRRLAIRKATLGAAEVPYQTALSALDLLKLLPELAVKGNSNAVSDIGVAGLLASTALKGAVFNVQINLQSLPDDYGVEMRKNLPSLIEEGRLYSRKCMDVVRMQLADS
ncbi:MAG: cyclodeaminase/cyclohydrolase family protein [Candidatus Thermoplasmatota archaeon]|nr:cyclodeaminase/cyclohydrolase family protein [Candidatus Thermoplasmatota archaeon]